MCLDDIHAPMGLWSAEGGTGTLNSSMACSSNCSVRRRRKRKKQMTQAIRIISPPTAPPTAPPIMASWLEVRFTTGDAVELDDPMDDVPVATGDKVELDDAVDVGVTTRLLFKSGTNERCSVTASV